MDRVITFTDFGCQGPYLAQMELAVSDINEKIAVTHLVTDAPAANPKLASYLLTAVTRHIQSCAVFLCVVDPGVGGDRLPIAISTGKHWFVGPDNGLLSNVIKRNDCQLYQITYRPENLSQTFHGRDLFAPVAASIAQGDRSFIKPIQTNYVGFNWPIELHEIIYIDHYGNLFTGINADSISQQSIILIAGKEIEWAKRFEVVDQGGLFWYENSSGLVEIAASGASAADLLSVVTGQRFDLQL